MTKKIIPLFGMMLALSACSNGYSDPYDSESRAISGGLLGGGAGAAIGALAGGGRGAAIGALAGGLLGAGTGAVTTPNRPTGYGYPPGYQPGYPVQSYAPAPGYYQQPAYTPTYGGPVYMPYQQGYPGY